MNLRTRQLFTTPLFAALGRLSGVLIPFVIAFFYGVSSETDSFFLSFSIAFFVFGIFQQVFESVLLPYLIEKKNHGYAIIKKTVFLVFLKVSIGLFFVLGLFVYFFPLFFNRFSGLDESMAIKTQEIFIGMLPFLLLAIAVSALNGVLNVYKHFAWPAVSPLVRSVSVVLAIFFFYQKMGIFAIPCGFAVGEFLRLVFTFAYFSKFQFEDSQSKSNDSTSHLPKSFWIQAMVQIVALALVQFIPLLNQWFATWLEAGDISVLGYAERLYLIPFQIFLAGMSQIYLSDWSERYLSLSRREFKQNVYQDALRMSILAFVICIVLYLGRFWIIRLTYGFGNNLQESMILEIANVFGWFILGFAPAVLTSLLIRIFFVMRHTDYFLAHSVVRLILQVFLNYYFVKIYGVQGIAISLTMGSLLSAGLTVLMLQPLWKVEKNG